MTAKQHERCAIQIEPSRSIKIVPEPNAKHLNEQQYTDYEDHRYRFIRWLREEGKNPEKVQGYSDYTAYETGYRTARFDRWVWQIEGGYTIPPTPEHADEYIDEKVSYRDVANATKGKTEEAIARYYRWLTGTYHVDEWEHDQRFSSSGDDAPRDYLTRKERQRIREAALETGSWREATIVLTSLDAALRPVEVNRARTGWVDIDNQMLRIPREDSSKNKDNWRTSLTSRTTDALNQWLAEREDNPAYDESDRLWLTRESTPYSSKSLTRLLRRLCGEAGIDTGGRTMTWYSIRHSTGTYLTAERDLKAAKDQLRHQTPVTTLKYDQVPAEQRREVLEKL